MSLSLETGSKVFIKVTVFHYFSLLYMYLYLRHSDLSYTSDKFQQPKYVSHSQLSYRQPSASGQRKQAKSKPGGQKKTSSSGSRQQLAKYLAQSRQPELGAAQMTLKTEDRAIRRKQEVKSAFLNKVMLLSLDLLYQPLLLPILLKGKW